MMAMLLQQAGLHGLGWADVAQLAGHFMVLSLLAVGGAITTAPDMQRWLVQQQGWLSDSQFAASVALAQAAPGPNILFVALVGWETAGAAGLVAALGGIMLPSSALALAVGRFGRQSAASLGLRAFHAGMAPVTIGLLLSTAWLLAAPNPNRWGTLGLAAATLWVMLRSKRSPLWPLALGAVAGAVGWA
jgi:chromate transporter